MTEQEQQIAMADACGWKPNKHNPYYWTGPNGESTMAVSLPDYLHDLNAMHEAEMALDEEHYRFFIHQLVCLLKPGEFSVRATAPKRAEALLRTLGKWKD